MNVPQNVVAWLCIFSTLVVGCYSSSAVYRTDDVGERIQSGRIQYVLTTDGKKYTFDKAPTVVNDTIVGGAQLTRERVSIALSETALIGEDSGRITYVLTKAGKKYTFEETPTVVGTTIIGEARCVTCDPLVVRIPLSDVQRIGLKEIDWGATSAVIIAALVATAVVIIVEVNDAMGKAWDSISFD
jgi:hypothetical protein